MKNVFLFTISFVLLLIGCGPQENVEQLKAVNYSLEKANDDIRNDISIICEELYEKKKDIQTVEEAEIWLPRANQILQYTDSIRALIKNLKNEIIVQSDSFKMEYVTAVRRLYEANGSGYQLLGKLSAFKDSIPEIINPKEGKNNPYEYAEVRRLINDIPLLPGYTDSLPAEQRVKFTNTWLDKNFGRSSSLMALIMLNKIENDVLSAGKRLMQYCNNQVFVFCGLGYRKFEAVAVLNSTYVKKGQQVEVLAGVGSFSDAAKPKITISGKEIKLGNDATAVYKFTVDGKPGTHNVMVKIEFYKPDGSREYITRTLKYTIADEK